jgi:glycosyltransferase involved in cell wall biosynthesis
MKQNVDLSVIIPTYRRPEYLAEALQKLLEVASLSIEIVVIDDSADAEGQEVVSALRDERVTYFRRDIPSNGRPAVLRNDAARKTSGAILYFFDDDDLVIPEALPGAYAVLQEAPQGVLLTLPQPFGANAQKVAGELAHFEKARSIIQRNLSAHQLEARLTFVSSFVVPSACLIKRSVFAAVGGFDEELAFFEDVDFFAKAIAADGYVFSDTPLVRRRVGHSSLIAAANTDALQRSYIELRRRFRARRGSLAYLANRVKLWLNDS